MKGCLSLIIKTLIAILVFFGLKYIGIIDFIQEKIDERNTGKQEQIKDKVKDILDLSQIDDEYSIDRTMKIFKSKVILVQHNATGQKMLMIEPIKDNMLTKEDITTGDIQLKIDDLLQKYKNKLLKFDSVKVVKQGTLNGIEQSIPYVQIQAEISNLPIKDMEGIVGVAELQNGKNLIIISINEKDKYSQIISEAFFNKVKRN